MTETSWASSVVDNQAVDLRDEFFHPIGEDKSWSESYYFYYFDPVNKIGGITRMGFRAYDGWKDYMHILFLENRHIVFCYDRMDMARGDEDLTVGDLTLVRGEPFQNWQIKFDGKGQDLQDGRVLIMPKKDRPEGWLSYAQVEMQIDFTAFARPHYMGDNDRSRHGHFEQIGKAVGHITVDGQKLLFDGFSLRDKSWGPRPWTDTSKGNSDGTKLAEGAASGLFVQWITAVCGPHLAFAVSFIRNPDGTIRTSGFIYKDGDYHQMLSGSVTSEFEANSVVHSGNQFSAVFENGYTLSGKGEIVNLGPSKIPMPGGATLVNSGMTRFELDTGDVAYGSSEYWIAVKR